MAFVAQLLKLDPRKLPKGASKTALAKVLRANKHLGQAVDALAKTKSRRAAVVEVMNKNPAFKTALTIELLKHQ